MINERFATEYMMNRWLRVSQNGRVVSPRTECSSLRRVWIWNVIQFSSSEKWDTSVTVRWNRDKENIYFKVCCLKKKASNFSRLY